MTQSATEGQQTGATGQAAGADAAAGQQAGGAAAGEGQQAGQAAGQQQAAVGTNTAGQTGNQTGQQSGQTGAAAGTTDDGLTDEERNALSDPGKRAVERIRGERDASRTENETLRSQLAEAVEKINKGGDAGLQTQITTITGERDAALQQSQQVMALMRNGLAVPKANETGEQFANRMSQLAGMLQGSDQAQLDASAAVLASLGGGQQAAGQQRTTTGDAHQAGQSGGQAGKPSMDDAIRAMAGRTVSS